MLPGEGSDQQDGLDISLDSINQGEQVLLELRGRDFDYSMLPDRAFQNLLIISVGKSTRDVEANLRELETKLETIGVIPVDAQTDSYSGPLWSTETIYPSDLTGISIALSQTLTYLREGRGWVVFDGLNILFMYVESGQLFRFVDGIATQCRSKVLHGVFTVDKTSVEPSDLNRFRQTFDTVLPNQDE